MSLKERAHPWPAASATGVGSMPGTDPAEAAAVVIGELADLPHLAELPARGPGADLIGRGCGLLVDMPAQTTAGGWKLASKPGRDLRRAAGMMSADLDAMQEAAEGFAGTFKIQACGPWTLAASVELNRSIELALADDGAVADLVASLAEGLTAHVSEVRDRLPGASILLQLDEPALPAVLAGSIPTASGLRRLPPVDETVAADNVRAVIDAVAAPVVVHCCARGVPFGCLSRSGAAAVSFDLGLLRRQDEDAFAEAVEAGTGMFIGAVPARPSPVPPDARAAARETAAAVIGLWSRIGLPPGQLTASAVLTPACGLAGAPAGYARAALARCQAAARLIPELIEEGAR